jgi:hypothetical protein
MAFPLEIQPADQITFKDAKIGEEDVTIDININNSTTDNYAIKLKCTSNELFRIHTPVLVVVAGNSSTIKITFKGRTLPNKQHYFFVHCFKLVDVNDQSKPRELWTAHKGVIESKRLPAEIVKAEATPNEEKKDSKTDAVEKKNDDEKVDNESVTDDEPKKQSDHDEDKKDDAE